MKTYFNCLEFLRGIAAILIAILHFTKTHTFGGYLAVDFFLVLSGFVLTHNYMYKKETIYFNFIANRISRLYPLHILHYLFIYIIAYYYLHNSMPYAKDGSYFTLLQQITMTHNIGLNPNGLTYNYPSWSISVEFWINLVFVFYITKYTKSRNLFFISLMLLIFIYGNSGNLDVYSKNYYNFINSGMLRGFASFFLGILSYRIYMKLYKTNIIHNLKLISTLEICILLAVFGMLTLRSKFHSGIDIFAPFLFMVMIAIFSLEEGIASKIFIRMKYLGKISYFIYLNQTVIILLFRDVLKNFHIDMYGQCMIYLFILLIYSHIAYKTIEIPAKYKLKSLFIFLKKD